MAPLLRQHVHKSILALLLVCLCFLPTHAPADELVDSGTTSKYVTAQNGTTQLATYRQHSSFTYIGNNIPVSRIAPIPKLTLFASPLLLITFLFIIQIRLKWQKLMPIKYGSRFVAFPSFGTKTIPERGILHDKVHTRRSYNDPQNRKRAQNFLNLHRIRFSCDACGSILFGLSESVPFRLGKECKLSPSISTDEEKVYRMIVTIDLFVRFDRVLGDFQIGNNRGNKGILYFMSDCVINPVKRGPQ